MSLQAKKNGGGSRWQRLSAHAMKLFTKEKSRQTNRTHTLDGLPEEALDILRKKFNALAEMVEREVREKTSLTA